MGLRIVGVPIPIFFLLCILLSGICIPPVLWMFIHCDSGQSLDSNDRLLTTFCYIIITGYFYCHFGDLIWVKHPQLPLCYSCRALYQIGLKQVRVRYLFSSKQLLLLLFAGGPVYMVALYASLRPTLVLVLMLAFLLEALSTSMLLKYVDAQYYKFFVTRIAMLVCSCFEAFGPTSLYACVVAGLSLAVLFLHHCLPFYPEQEVCRLVWSPFPKGTVFSCARCSKRMGVV